MVELEHSPLGGSGAHRFMNCTFSFLQQREEIENGQFEDIPSEFAILGTAAHELGAKSIAQSREPYEFIGEEINGLKVGWEGGIELDAVTTYFNYCMGILARRKNKGRMLLETTIHLPEIHELLRGTVDFGFWSPADGVDLIDYKNGEGIGVVAPNNKQLLYYGFLLIMSDPWLRAGPRDLPVRLGICQPNFYGIFEEPDIWHTTLGHVVDWGLNELLPKMNALTSTFEGPTPEDAKPGDWCQFCPVMLSCPPLRRAFETYAAAEEDFIEMLTNAELNDLYVMRDQARRFGKALENTVHARLIGGGSIPSAKLVDKKTNRIWKPGAALVLEQTYGDKAYVKKIVSPAAAEKLDSRGKALALEYAYKPEAHGLAVAPLSDPRPEAKPRTNAATFANFAQSVEEQGF